MRFSTLCSLCGLLLAVSPSTAISLPMLRRSEVENSAFFKLEAISTETNNANGKKLDGHTISLYSGVLTITFNEDAKDFVGAIGEDNKLYVYDNGYTGLNQFIYISNRDQYGELNALVSGYLSLEKNFGPFSVNGDGNLVFDNESKSIACPSTHGADNKNDFLIKWDTDCDDGVPVNLKVKRVEVPVSAVVVGTATTSSTEAAEPTSEAPSSFGIIAIHSGNSNVHLRELKIKGNGLFISDNGDSFSASIDRNYLKIDNEGSSQWLYVDSRNRLLLGSSQSRGATPWSAVGSSLAYNNEKMAIACPTTADGEYQIYWNTICKNGVDINLYVAATPDPTITQSVTSTTPEPSSSSIALSSSLSTDTGDYKGNTDTSEAEICAAVWARAASSLQASSTMAVIATTGSNAAFVGKSFQLSASRTGQKFRNAKISVQEGRLYVSASGGKSFVGSVDANGVLIYSEEVDRVVYVNMNNRALNIGISAQSTGQWAVLDSNYLSLNGTQNTIACPQKDTSYRLYWTDQEFSCDGGLGIGLQVNFV
ncbi:hypothetical protein NADFUDRAFT_53679 [Nadsonia fulvescens var. elongata DSM 6958]|uniref:Hyphally-regulated cell wall protein N-terminal domain-containing protein n=1 Tax=Nadsonia fulvescens var. elongata DSM 6958 TaxID=857566 RepID=A0A1E3PDW5_9ASCO|nr:hypothetical protein NADFUDRAFT_53679 [Nadsonia fulvescens var. elongata DSM 6958]